MDNRNRSSDTLDGVERMYSVSGVQCFVKYLKYAEANSY